MALSKQALPYQWDWEDRDGDKARQAFEQHYGAKRQKQIKAKLDALCQHTKGDIEKVASAEGYFRQDL